MKLSLHATWERGKSQLDIEFTQEKGAIVQLITTGEYQDVKILPLSKDNVLWIVTAFNSVKKNHVGSSSGIALLQTDSDTSLLEIDISFVKNAKSVYFMSCDFIYHYSRSWWGMEFRGSELEELLTELKRWYGIL